MAFMFEKLEVYQKALNFTDQITSLTKSFPRGYYFLTGQLNRAALSIATNIAEGNGRFTKADRKNFFIIARGSVQECLPLLGVVSSATTMGAVTDDTVIVDDFESYMDTSALLAAWDQLGGSWLRLSTIRSNESEQSMEINYLNHALTGLAMNLESSGVTELNGLLANNDCLIVNKEYVLDYLVDKSI